MTARRLTLLTGLVVTFGTTTAVAGVLPPAQFQHRPCPKTFTVKMARRAVAAIYGGTRDVTGRQRRLLGRIALCQRAHTVRTFTYVRALELQARKAWLARRNPPFNGPALASWFYDAGAVACGAHYAYGFATLDGTPCGGAVTFKGPNGAVVTGYREDSGPYIPGRTFDLNPALRDALGCGGVCTVYYR